MTAPKLDFYHDQGGTTIGQKKFAATMEKNICSNPSVRVRREAIADSVHMFPMMSGNKLYGAIIEGNNQSYTYRDGAPEVLAARGRFTHFLLLKDGKWTVTRVFSYNHKPV